MLNEMFTKAGYKRGAFKIHCPSTVEMKMTTVGDTVKLDFINSRPTVTFKKFIKISREVSGVFLSKSGGTIELNNFPDLPFEYEDIDS